MKKINLIIACILLLQVSVHAQSTKNRYFHLFVGTYTNGTSEGIYTYKFDSQTGEATLSSVVKGIKNPSYLAISKNAEKLYAIGEAGEDKKGVANAFDIDKKTGKLTFLNQQSSFGPGPCYVAVSDDNKYVFTANYGGGSVGIIPLKNDGSLGEAVQGIQHTGKSINTTRQEKPHAHSVMFSPDKKFLLAADLGTDKLYTYKYEASAEKPLTLANTPFTDMTPGSGPRHFTFSKNGKLVYVVQELAAVISVYKYNNGVLTKVEDVNMNEVGFNGQNGAADIHISNDGKFLYATNRGSVNEIVTCKIEADGKLKLTGRTSTMGKTPRNFMIDPTDKFLLVANQNSGNIQVFNRDKNTGALTFSGKTIDVDKPVCLKMIAAE